MPKRDRLLLAGVLVSPSALEFSSEPPPSRHPRAALALGVVSAVVLALALGFVGGPATPTSTVAAAEAATSVGR